MRESRKLWESIDSHLLRCPNLRHLHFKARGLQTRCGGLGRVKREMCLHSDERVGYQKPVAVFFCLHFEMAILIFFYITLYELQFVKKKLTSSNNLLNVYDFIYHSLNLHPNRHWLFCIREQKAVFLISCLCNRHFALSKNCWLSTGQCILLGCPLPFWLVIDTLNLPVLLELPQAPPSPLSARFVLGLSATTFRGIVHTARHFSFTVPNEHTWSSTLCMPGK